MSITPVVTTTTTQRKIVTTRKRAELTEEQAATILRRHFALSESATVEFVITHAEELLRVVLTDVVIVEDTEETSSDA